MKWPGSRSLLHEDSASQSEAASYAIPRYAADDFTTLLTRCQGNGQLSTSPWSTPRNS